MSCCVIGGGGFIGQHLVQELANQGKSIIVVDLSQQFPEWLPSGVNYITGNYSDRRFLYKVLKGIDEVIDLAYASVPKTSFDDPIQDILSNLPSAINLFEIASDLKIKKVVVVSSGGTIYGKVINLPIAEDHPTDPISPYGITKLAIEKYAKMYHTLKGLPVVFVRPANAFGERQKPFTAQGFIATAIASALTGREINLFGEQGTIRDYIYVKDVVSGIIAVLKHGKTGESYNIGSGIGRSNREVLKMIANIAKSENIELRVKVLPPRKYDVPSNILNCSKLQNETGWSPTVSLMEGLELTWRHFKEQYNQ